MNRKLSLILFIFVWVLSSGFTVPTALAGEISGRILVTKTLTKKRIVLPSYQSRNFSPPLKQDTAVDKGEFGRIAIYLEGPAATVTPTNTKLIQQDMRFDPEILVIPVGSVVSFPNGDPIFHNVFSLSKPKQFDLGYYPIGQTRLVKFNRTGVVQVYCHLHPQMSAAILIIDSSWYTRPDEAGTFSFSKVPAGTYELVAWHKSAGFFKHRVELPETGSIQVDLTIPLRDTEAQ